MKTQEFFRCVDRVPFTPFSQQSNMKGKLTGEFRCPKAGEWYLSGAIPECYRAKNNLTTPFHIVKIVTTKTTLKVEEVVE